MSNKPERQKKNLVTQEQEEANPPSTLAEAAQSSSEAESTEHGVDDLPEAVVEPSIDLDVDVLVLLDDDAISDVTMGASGCDLTVESSSETTSVEEVALLKVHPDHVDDFSLQDGGVGLDDGDLPLVEDGEDITSLVEETTPLGIEDDLDLSALEEKGSFPWRPAAAAAVFLLALFLLPLLPDGSQPAVNSVVTNGSGTVTSLSTGNPAFEQWLDEVLANQLKAVTPTPEQG